MKRRDFLKMLGLAPVVALPVAAAGFKRLKPEQPVEHLLDMSCCEGIDLAKPGSDRAGVIVHEANGEVVRSWPLNLDGFKDNDVVNIRWDKGKKEYVATAVANDSAGLMSVQLSSGDHIAKTSYEGAPRGVRSTWTNVWVERDIIEHGIGGGPSTVVGEKRCADLEIEFAEWSRMQHLVTIHGTVKGREPIVIWNGAGTGLCQEMAYSDHFTQGRRTMELNGIPLAGWDDQLPDVTLIWEEN